MDYGQPTNPPIQEPFFTVGVGNAPEANNPDKNQSLNTDNYSPERDPRNLGNTAITSSEQLTEVEPTQELKGANGETLGQIVNLEMPPGMAEPTTQNPTKTPDLTTSTIKTTNKLNEAGMKAVRGAESQLSQDGNAANFYDLVRGEGGLSETNLKNSFGREVA
ncbi:hypothetical protein J6V85_04030 [Candidatus Saccharibacteria bacterium]|nr:hypothetical protein [Candidatus Saccharibacteria bacterium]